MPTERVCTWCQQAIATGDVYSRCSTGTGYLHAGCPQYREEQDRG